MPWQENNYTSGNNLLWDFRSRHGLLQSDIAGVNAELCRAHAQHSQQFMIGNQFAFDIGMFLRVCERFSLFEFTYVLVDGDQHILQKSYIRVFAIGQSSLLGYYTKRDLAFRLSRQVGSLRNKHELLNRRLEFALRLQTKASL